jgi:hypothetical protein
VQNSEVAVICAANAMMAQDKPALTGVDLLAAKPGDYTGKIIAVSGIVERVSEAKHMFTLIESPRQAAQMAASGR